MKYWRKPLDLETTPVVKGRVLMVQDRCKGCEFCITYCSRGVLSTSRSFNRKGYHYPEADPARVCANCHFCEAICPEFAIFSVEDQ
ncbi:2-oxoglutarate ferredoxin oxidoreductase subunit delta [Desulfarculales bacterium]